MPTTYAHYRFGKEVYDKLPGSLRTVVDRNADLYYIGLHGPDILFYYNPLGRNHVNGKGYDCHEMTGEAFFGAASKAVLASLDREAALSYLVGVLCHYVLDRACHPYVAVKEKDGVSHTAIEASFDRCLMELDGFDPLTYVPVQHLHPTFGMAALISDFYIPLTPNEVYAAMRSMIAVLKTIATPPGRKRTALFKAFRAAHHEKLTEYFMTEQPDLRFTDSDERLLALYEEASDDYLKFLAQLLDHIESGAPFGEEFRHTFGEE